MKFAFVIALTVVTTFCCVLWGLFGNDPMLLSAHRVLQSLRGLNRIGSNTKWEILSSLFGTQMEYTFGGEETFEYAHPDPITATGDGYRVRCTDYNTELHEGIGMPFYVDESSNTICYAGNSFALPNTIVPQEAFNIDFLVTAPLKIHYNVYDLVDKLAAPVGTTATISTPQVITSSTDNGLITSTPSVSVDDEHNPHPPLVSVDDDHNPRPPIATTSTENPKPTPSVLSLSAFPDDLTVMFELPAQDNESTTDSSDGNNGESPGYYTVVAQHLSSYDFSYVNDFFWTSPGTLAHYPPNSNHPSAVRARTWSTLVHVLRNHLVTNSDPCMLTSSSVIHHENQLAVPLHQLSSLANSPTSTSTNTNNGDDDHALAAACLAYISATFATQPWTRLAAVTHRPATLNYRARSIDQNPQVGSASSYNPYSAAGLLGDNQVVAISDTGLDLTSCWFSDPTGHVNFSLTTAPVKSTAYRKVLQYTYLKDYGDTSDEVNGHGTHTSGTVVGSIKGANLYGSGMYAGVAPNAKICFMDLAQPGQGLAMPSPISALWSVGYNCGARAQSCSFGSPWSGTHGYYAASDVDTYLYQHTGLIVFYAAGNYGGNGDGSYTCTMEATSKNAVIVGSSESTFDSIDIGNVAYYSSKGPVYDGRIKPDLVAPGDAIMSAQSNGNSGASCGTVEKTGTSMATPSAAGAALLVRQYFADSTGVFWKKVCNKAYTFCKGFTASGVLIKAVLLHSGTPMKQFDGDACGCGTPSVSLNNPPDFTQGYGRITLSNVLPLYNTFTFDLFVLDLVRINANTKLVYHAHVTNTNNPLKVTISWYDPPNTAGTTGKALINNLDLLVVAPGKTTVLKGNGGDGQGNFDTLNNNEQVYVKTPVLGQWEIVVIANALPYSGSQLFSIVVTCAAGTVVVTNPKTPTETDDYYHNNLV